MLQERTPAKFKLLFAATLKTHLVATQQRCGGLFFVEIHENTFERDVSALGDGLSLHKQS